MGYGDFSNTTILNGPNFGFSFTSILKAAKPSSVAKKIVQSVKTVKKVSIGANKFVVKTTNSPVVIIGAAMVRGPKAGLDVWKQEFHETTEIAKDTVSPVASPIAQGAVEIEKTSTVQSIEEQAKKRWNDKIGKISRQILFNKYTDPAYQVKVSNRNFSRIPIYDKCYNKIDEYSGYTLTQVDVGGSVAGKFGRGENVSKAEFLTAAVVAMKAGAIVAAAFTGGSSLALLAVAGTLASSMKQGPLGKTETGRVILTLVEVACYAASGYLAATSAGTGAAAEATSTTIASSAGSMAGGMAATVGATATQQAVVKAVTVAIIKKSQEMIAEKIGKEIAQKLHIGVLAQIAVTAALGPESFKDSMEKAAETKGVEQAGKVLGPTGKLIAQSLVAATINANSAETLGKAVTVNNYSDKLQTEIENRIREEALKKIVDESNRIFGVAGQIVATAGTTAYTASTAPVVINDLKNPPPQATFNELFQKELDAGIRAEALRQLQISATKALGPTGAALIMAAAKGEDVTAKTGIIADEKARAAINTELAQQTNSIVDLNGQKAQLLSSVATADPATRDQLMYKAMAIDTNIANLQANRTINMQKLGYSTSAEQSQLTNNSKTAQTNIKAVPNYSLTAEQRQAKADQTTLVESGKLDDLNANFFDYSVRVQNNIGKLKELADQATTLKEQGKMKEAEEIEKQMVPINAQVEKDEATALFYHRAAETQKAQGAVKVAAAAEGRYEPVSNYQHPLLWNS